MRPKQKPKPKLPDIVDPLNYFEFEEAQKEQLPSEKAKPARTPRRNFRQRQARKNGRGIFITATDTGVGKTVAVCVLANLLRQKGFLVGVMKPVQCGGKDTLFLKQHLHLKEPLPVINPYFAKEPLAPNVAFGRQKIAVHRERIMQSFHQLQGRYDIVLVEGAGGLLVPITDDYWVVDMVKDLDCELVIVARPGLGTINHTLLTVEQARGRGLRVKGVIFSEATDAAKGVPEETNPEIIARLGEVAVLGVIPHLKNFQAQEIMAQCQGRIDFSKLLDRPEFQSAKDLAAWDKQYVWHPFTQMKDWLSEEPLMIDRARGNYLIDVQGNRYLDGVSSLWVNVHGHGHKQIDRALSRQAGRLSHSTLLGLANTPSVQLAKKLTEIAPAGLEKVFYSDNGSTAVEVAVKMAYQYWQNVGRLKKTRIAHLSNAYHGDTLGSVSIGGIDLFHKVYRNLTFQTVKVDFPDCYRAAQGKKYPEHAFEYVEGMEKLFETSHQSIAALVVEPLVQGAAGMIVWPSGILKRMAELCRRYDIFLIADEVATGFGRTGKMFACEHEEVSPDFLCLAKGLTGGYLPLAATLTTKRIFEGFVFDHKEQKTFFHGHTYTGNPLGCAAALANLEIFEKEQTLQNLQPKINFLAQKLKMFYNLAHVGDVRQKGLMAGIELVKNKKTKDPFPWEEKAGARVCQEARKHGVVLRPLGNVIVLMPPLSITEREIVQLTEACYKSIAAVVR